jgi:Carboxypeptidase regulatory-like domain
MFAAACQPRRWPYKVSGSIKTYSFLKELPVMRASLRFVVHAALVLMVSCSGARLYAQYTTSTLSVSVTDPAGAPLPDATVTVLSLDTGLEKASVSGANGGFVFTALPVGRYSLSVAKAGFSTFTQTGITLALDQPLSVPVKLKVGSVNEQVLVAADADLINTESGTVGQLIDAQRIVDLPLNGREPQALLFLAAGTVNETGNYCLVNCQGGVYPGEQAPGR